MWGILYKSPEAAVEAFMELVEGTPISIVQLLEQVV
jgi:hypothetical protein